MIIANFILLIIAFALSLYHFGFIKGILAFAVLLGADCYLLGGWRMTHH